MNRSASLGTRTPLQTKIVVPVSIVTIAALFLCGFALIWTARESNIISIDRQLRTTERSIRAIVDELAQQQEMVAVWDDAILQLRKKDLDWQWLDANMGVWLSRTFGQDQVYILDPDDRPIYAAVDQERAPVAVFAQARPYLEGLVLGLRGHEQSPHAKHVQLSKDNRVLKTGKAVFDAHLLELLGRPAAVSAMMIVPESDQVTQEQGREFLLVSIRFLDTSFLEQLSERNLIEGLRFSRWNGGLEGEASVPLLSDEGQLIGYFLWTPELPGARSLYVLAPAAGLTAVTIVAVMMLLVRSLRRSVAQQEIIICELRASEAQAQHLAFHDVLTGLPNRALFDDRLDQALARTQRGGRTAVLMLDLDRFKHVNDTLGHHAGDSLIREVAGRLSKLTRSSDTVARLGGDEFAIVQTDIFDEEDVNSLCVRILAAVQQPFEVLGHQVFVGGSIGVALAPEAGSERVEIVRKADIALYRAKEDGRGCHRIFSSAMDETVKVRSSIEDELRAALTTGEGFEVAYQAQVAAAGKSIVGLEALLRWRHPALGTILPEQFIPVAEQTGLIIRLGEWVLHEACSVSQRWPDLFISINLSPIQFRSENFAERVIAIVRASGADPRKIELEVTEGVLLDAGGETANALRKLRRAGFRIALDDFGTGYSSLGYLQKFEVDKIKIDRSFVKNLGQDENATAIVEAIVALGQALNLTVTAEGVETREQGRFLDKAGCDELQGYLFSKALPTEQIALLLAAPPPTSQVQRSGPSSLHQAHDDRREIVGIGGPASAS
ncbi:putative bifunctional diguanylate cyclase/phosphodiesterase [Microvirga makkahensis]|uniref:EAL domain-containing protein n=1 Tax=Microvirga makkahensis TaxID=1128670 RepID=A0A7X3MPN6_9HYPH|nr:EAL domain-containing protein [Microvirga makkahensis]MXQ10768.1 EAL domain-containing protein [Microvirga makkahensis]